MIIHNSPLDDYSTSLYNLMCEIERDVYSTCAALYETVKEYTDNHGMPGEWAVMSTREWYEYFESIEHDDSDTAIAARAYFRIIFSWDFLESVHSKFSMRAEELLRKPKRAWEWIDTITNRSLESYRSANRDLLSMQANAG